MGLTKIVIEGEKAKDVYDLLCRAKQYRFAFGMDQVVKYEIEDDLYPRGPMTVTTTVRPDVFKLLTGPNDDECRYVTEFGNIEFEFADSVLKVSEDTYGDE